MAVSDAPVTTYSDTTAHRRAISDYISLIDPSDTPVVAYFGLGGSPGQFRIVNWPSSKIEWLEDDLAALAGTLGASIDSTATGMTVTDATLYKVGSVAEIGTEMVWVSAKNTSTNVLTVTRAYGSTTAASHANAATVTMVSLARLEGATTTFDYKTDVTAPYNYTQIFQAGVKVTRSQNKIMQYGIADELRYQVNKKIPELSRLIEKSFFRGKRNSGSASAPRTFGGLETFLTNNTASLAAAALTRKDIEDRIQAVWEDGGNPDMIICGPWVKRKISSFYEDSVRTERLEDQGGVVIDEVLTEFGMLRVLMSRWCPSTKLYIVSTEHIGFLEFDQFAEYDVPRTGDFEAREVIGEYALVVRHDKAHGFIKSISTTS